MCGIAGTYKIQSPIEQMVNSLAHRGNTPPTFFDDGTLQVGHTRLAIIEASQNKQPATSGNWVVFLNGCIYNYKELIKESHGDTHAIAIGIDRHGIDFVKRLNGMFAIVAYNKESKECFLIRDRYGIKPLYFWHSGEKFVFASEIRAILESNHVKLAVDAIAVKEWFTWQNYTQGRTLFQDIKMLSAGSILALHNQTIQRYWDWDFIEEEMGYEEAKEETERLLKQAVKRQLIGGEKISIWLSGGIDSSLIAKYTDGIEAYCCKMQAEGFDETEKAKLAAAQFHKCYYEYPITSQTIKQYLEKTIWHLEDLRVGQSYSNYALAKLTASNGNMVNLQGSGGDELFAGYTWRMERKYSDDRTGLGLLKKEVFNRQYEDASNFLQGVLLVDDKISMAHGIEGRVPFLDNDLVDFAQMIPLRHKMGKKILRDILGVPELSQQRKWGFTSPDKLWFANENRTWVEEALKEKRYRDYIHVEIDFNNPPLIWCLLAFETWLKLFHD